MASNDVCVEIGIPRFSRFWPDLAPATPGPDPNFYFLGGFPKVAKRFCPLRPPNGLRLSGVVLTRRDLTDPGGGLAINGLSVEIGTRRFSGLAPWALYMGVPGPYYMPIILVRCLVRPSYVYVYVYA